MIPLNAKMNISDAGVEFIANHEGFRSSVYKDTGGLDTIGFGHLVTKCEHFYEPITLEEGLKLFKTDLERFVNCIRANVKVKLNQNQFDALVSLAYNIGTSAFIKSTVARLLNAGDYDGAAAHILDWKYDASHKPVLLSRREAERALFVKP